MMKSITRGLSAILFALAGTAALAADTGTTGEAMALVKKAVAHLKSVDREKALADFNDPHGKFVDRDLYIFVLDTKGSNLAIGSAAMRKTVGVNLSDMRDADGKYFVRDMLEVAGTKGSGWVDFKFPNFSKNNAIETKSGYVEKVGDLVIGCGAFK
jgi:signal transduction histidine kinase